MTQHKRKQKPKLLGPAGRLIKRGWCQGSNNRTVKGLVCYYAYGAIMATYPGGDERSGYGFSQAISKLSAVVGNCITKWNDDPKRTKAEVLAAFRKAGV